MKKPKKGVHGRGSRFKDHFSVCAAGYATHRPTYPAALVDFLAGLAPAREVAWDCGCGSGQMSQLLAGHFARVIATDASRSQIRQAKPHPRIDYRVAAAEESGLRDGSVDLIMVAQAVHWFDLERFYAEVRRVARPRALLALVAYGIMFIDQAVDPTIATFYSDVLGRFWPPERRAIEEGYASLRFPFARLDTPRFDMVVEWDCDQVLGYINTWSAVAALKRSRGHGEVEKFGQALRQTWGDTDTRTVRWPLVVCTGVVV